MKTRLLFPVGAILLMIMSFSSCEKDNLKKTARYSFWKGDIENHYYVLDMNDQPLQLVKGKPFMVVEYDPVTNVPISCEFGLSEAENEYLPGAEGVIPEPFLSAGTLSYADKLDLQGSVCLLSNWKTVTTCTELSAGGFEFSIDKGSDMWGHEILHFTYTFDDMTGEIINDEVTWGGRVSDANAFQLARKFNSNSLN